jgi:hypothetical protein
MDTEGRCGIIIVSKSASAVSHRERLVLYALVKEGLLDSAC